MACLTPGEKSISTTPAVYSPQVAAPKRRRKRRRFRRSFQARESVHRAFPSSCPSPPGGPPDSSPPAPGPRRGGGAPSPPARGNSSSSSWRTRVCWSSYRLRLTELAQVPAGEAVDLRAFGEDSHHLQLVVARGDRAEAAHPGELLHLLRAGDGDHQPPFPLDDKGPQERYFLWEDEQRRRRQHLP